jgi:hypothetical protein
MTDYEHGLWIDGNAVEAAQVFHCFGVRSGLSGQATGQGLGCNVSNMLIDDNILQHHHICTFPHSSSQPLS